MRETPIVPLARTPIGIAVNGSLDKVKSPTRAAHATSAAVDRAGLDPSRVDVSGGHPYGMTGVPLAGHPLIGGRRRAASQAVVTMCLGNGIGAAGFREIA